MRQSGDLPGGLLHRIARAVMDEDDVARAIEPAIADLQLEQARVRTGFAAGVRARMGIVALVILVRRTA